MPQFEYSSAKIERFEHRYDARDLIEKLQLPTDVPIQVFVEIPSGGDYSGEELHIDSFTPVIFKWERVTND